MRRIYNLAGAIFLILFFIFTFSNPSLVYAVDSTGQWVKVASMSTPRYGHSAVLLKDGRVLLSAGRYDFLNTTKTSEIYNPLTKTWSSTGNINSARYIDPGPGMVQLPDGKIFTAGGWGEGLTDVSTSEVYDPKTGNWSLVASPNIPRRLGALANLPNGEVLIASGSHGGSGSDRHIAAAEIYNPTTNIWTYTGNMNFGRDSSERFITLLDGRVMIAGGESSRAVAENTAEIYDPNNGKWTISTMPYSMQQGALTLLDDGRVLLTGGSNGTQVVNNAAIYNPATNTWSSVSPMLSPRKFHNAFLLSDGKVLIFGGNNEISNFNNPFNTSEIYDPIKDTWTVGPSLPQGILLSDVTKLQNGDYLVTGGTNGNNILSDAYLFTSSNQPLTVPFFKQTSSPWQSQEYDSAHIWNPSDITINAWGCAMTSAAMVFKYYDINKLPDGTELDPETLNSWLKSQPDGYVGEGWVNWLALSRLSKLAVNINNIPKSNRFATLDG